MKYLFTLVIICILATACKKEAASFNDKQVYLAQVKTGLKDSLGAALLDELDFSKVILSEVDSSDLHFLNVPLRNSHAGNFVLVQTDKEGNIRQGRLITLEKDNSASATMQQYNGRITIRSLKEELLIQSAISDGSILALHRPGSRNNRHEQLSLMQSLAPAYETLPEVVVIGYRDPTGGISYSDWISLQSMFGGGSGMPANSYTPMSGSGGGSGSYGGTGGGYGGGGGTGSSTQVPPMELEEENSYSLPAVDIKKVFKCFDYIPSQGATFKIRLCTDLPSNNYPDASANYSSASAGHTFLIVTKTNDNVSITQSFGFYPQSAPSWLEPFSLVSATLRDNGAQEINASIEMSINEYQFNTIKKNAIILSSKEYSLGDYNCTNYALDVFNSVRTSPILVQPYKLILPGSTDAYNSAAEPISVLIEESPQMLFSKLRQMKSSNGPESSSILVDQSHNYRAPISKGECD